ncbi:MAG: GNAT family N-acetyltransferase [Kiritimatiellia bacterium]
MSGLTIRTYGAMDLPEITAIWNEVVEAGNAFPQEAPLTVAEAECFFASQSRTSVACLDGCIAGLAILHPNNVGRCGHIANASYAVASRFRGQGIGEALVRDCLQNGRLYGFRVLQFNAVVATNTAAIKLYEKLGFKRLGTIPGGFRDKHGDYLDIYQYFHTL